MLQGCVSDTISPFLNLSSPVSYLIKKSLLCSSDQTKVVDFFFIKFTKMVMVLRRIYFQQIIWVEVVL